MFAMLRNQCSENKQLRVATFKRSFCILLCSTQFKCSLSSKKNCLNDDFEFSKINSTVNLNDQYQYNSINIQIKEFEQIEFNLTLFNPLIDNGSESSIQKDINFDVCVYIAGFLIKKLRKFLFQTCLKKLKTNNLNYPGLLFTIEINMHIPHFFKRARFFNNRLCAKGMSVNIIFVSVDKNFK